MIPSSDREAAPRNGMGPQVALLLLLLPLLLLLLLLLPLPTTNYHYHYHYPPHPPTGGAGNIAPVYPYPLGWEGGDQGGLHHIRYLPVEKTNSHQIPPFSLITNYGKCNGRRL